MNEYARMYMCASHILVSYSIFSEGLANRTVYNFINEFYRHTLQAQADRSQWLSDIESCSIDH